MFVFFVLFGLRGVIIHCSSLNSNDPHMVGRQNSDYGCNVLNYMLASIEAFIFFVIVLVVNLAMLGIMYVLLATTMEIQRIWQRHYYILTKRKLIKVNA
ncbi:putative sodium-coupled neutral amino acid transporter 6 [Bienertia sinuspersici]